MVKRSERDQIRLREDVLAKLFEEALRVQLTYADAIRRANAGLATATGLRDGSFVEEARERVANARESVAGIGGRVIGRIDEVVGGHGESPDIKGNRGWRILNEMFGPQETGDIWNRLGDMLADAQTRVDSGQSAISRGRQQIFGTIATTKSIRDLFKEDHPLYRAIEEYLKDYKEAVKGKRRSKSIFIEADPNLAYFAAVALEDLTAKGQIFSILGPLAGVARFVHSRLPKIGPFAATRHVLDKGLHYTDGFGRLDQLQSALDKVAELARSVRPDIAMSWPESTRLSIEVGDIPIRGTNTRVFDFSASSAEYPRPPKLHALPETGQPDLRRGSESRGGNSVVIHRPGGDSISVA